MTSKLTRERLSDILEFGSGRLIKPISDEEIELMARMALAAMDSEPVFTLQVSQADYKGQKLGNQFGFVTLDTARELDEGNYQLYAAQPAPVENHIGSKNALDAIVSFIKSKGNPTVKCYEEVSEQLFKDNCHGIHSHIIEYILKLGEELEDLRAEQDESQPAPVVPDDVLEALQKVARIRLDLNDFDGDRRGIVDCLGDAEEALIEVVNRRAATLAAASQEVSGE